MLQKIMLLALAGALGTLSRYGLSGLVQKMFNTNFPIGTLVVNIAGCFLAGLIWSLCEHRINISGQTRAIILIGFMGAFTTFSTYILESGQMMQDTEWFRAFGNIVLQNGIGFFMLYAGIVIGKIA